MADQIQAIPPTTSAAQLIGAVNDRLRQINAALAAQSTSSASSTPIQYGTSATRLARPLSGFQDAALWWETDTKAMYQIQGNVWVAIGGGLAQLAYATGALTLAPSSSWGDVTGATLTLTRAGRHLITGNFCFVQSGTAAETLEGRLVADGSAQTQLAFFLGAVNQIASVSEQWLYTAGAAGKIVKLQGTKVQAGVTTAQIQTTHTSISALWVGP